MELMKTDPDFELSDYFLHTHFLEQLEDSQKEKILALLQKKEAAERKERTVPIRSELFDHLIPFLDNIFEILDYPYIIKED